MRTYARSEALRHDLHRQLLSGLARRPDVASAGELYTALARALREAVAPRWLATEAAYAERGARQVCYVSMEFHLGRLLRSALQALDLEDAARETLDPLGVTLEELEEREADPSLGSGGLGRLAACFLDSLATLDLPAYGYGLRYDLGLFKQVIDAGQQREEPDPWVPEGGWPWEVVRPSEAVRVSFSGHVERFHDADGREHHRWVGADEVLAVPHDVPDPGYKTGTVGTLRLWSARPPRGAPVDFHAFQAGAYRSRDAVAALTAFLYPADDTRDGKLLRLAQQYLLSSATLQDVVRRHLAAHESLDTFHESWVVQLNDTHPALAIPELMRLLMDEHGYTWDAAWALTQKTFAYTNHTLLPEALETWGTDLIGELLPRHLQLIQEIDRRFQDEVRAAFPGDGERIRRMAVIEPGQPGRVRMAHLSVVGGHSVNGVAALHTRLLREGIMRDFDELYPTRFSNKTNGITPRRWLKQANPGLAALVTEELGEAWESDLSALGALAERADDPELQRAFRAVKRKNKLALAEVIAERVGEQVDPDSLFDVQIKRFHEYKRQLLLVLWAIARYQELCANPAADVVPRTVIFAGKAAASYDAAKQVIALIHGVAQAIATHEDPRVRAKLKVIFLPNYSVSLAERIVPAADLSEQISTAGYEASGTGNMKLALNGALTIGTLDGANVEIREEVGPENLFIFGLRAEQVRQLRDEGYDPQGYADQNPKLAKVLEAIADDTFSPGGDGTFRALVDELLGFDRYMLLADFAAYSAAQEQVDARYRDPAAWSRAAILNTARAGKFSSDRTIQDYAREIWALAPVDVPLPDLES